MYIKNILIQLIQRLLTLYFSATSYNIPMTNLSQSQSFAKLLQLTSLPLDSFQTRLEQLQYHPKLLSQFLKVLKTHTKNQRKQMAAVGINYLLKKQLKIQGQLENTWEQFYREVVCNQIIDCIQWRHLCIVFKSCKLFFQKMELQLCNILNPLFPQFPVNIQALFYDAFVQADTTEQMKLVFIRQTIEIFLTSAYTFICCSHDSHQNSINSFTIQNSIMNVLEMVMCRLQGQQSMQKITDMIIFLSMNSDLFQIIIEVLLFNPFDRNYRSTLTQSFSPQRMGQLKYYLDQGQGAGSFDLLNQNKANALNILVAALSHYDLKSGMQDFDTKKYLFFMQNSIPFIIDHLIRSNPKNKANIIAMLKILTRACRFNFLLQTFTENKFKIYFQIILPLLNTSDKDRQIFESSPDQFIDGLQQLIDKSNSQCQYTVRTALESLLARMADVLDGFVSFVVEMSCKQIRSVLRNEEHLQIRQVMQQHKVVPSVQRALLVIAIFSHKYHARQDIKQYLKIQLIQLEQMTRLSGIQKAHFLILLAYTYQMFYQSQPDQGRRFLVLANQSIDTPGTISYCSLMLFYNCIKLGFGNDIWQSLISKLNHTQNIHIFKAFRKIIKKMMNQLPVDKLIELMEHLKTRLIIQYDVCRKLSQEKHASNINGNKFLFICLDITQIISQNTKYIKQQPAVIQHIWPVLGLLQFAQKIQFEDEVLKILNNIIKAQEEFSSKHFAFLPSFVHIYRKQQKLGQLLKTFQALLLKGRSHFFRDQQGKHDLQKLLQTLVKCFISFKTAKTLRQICILHHYAINEYSNIISPRSSIVALATEEYYSKKSQLDQQTIASIINVLLVSEWAYGQTDLSIMRQNDISIFRGYQSKILAQSLMKMVIKNYFDQQQVFVWLQTSLRLLHYVRQCAQYRTQSSYYFPSFAQGLKLDPFELIGDALDFVKSKLQPQDYDRLVQKLSEEITLGDIKDLLSRRIVNRKIRTYVNVSRASVQ